MNATPSASDQRDLLSGDYVLAEIESTEAYASFPAFVAVNGATLEWFIEKRKETQQIRSQFPDIRRTEYYLSREMKIIFLRDDQDVLDHAQEITTGDLDRLSIGEAKNPHIQIQLLLGTDRVKGRVRASHEDFHHHQHFFKSGDIYELIRNLEGQESGVLSP